MLISLVFKEYTVIISTTNVQVLSWKLGAGNGCVTVFILGVYIHRNTIHIRGKMRKPLHVIVMKVGMRLNPEPIQGPWAKGSSA